MMMLKNISLKARLLVASILVLFIIIPSGYVVSMLADINAMRDDAKNTSALIAKTLGQFSVTDLAFRDKTAAEESLAHLRVWPEVMCAHIFDQDGELFANYIDKDDHVEVRRPLQESTHYFDDASLNVVEPIIYRGQVYGWAYMKVSTELLEQGIASRIRHLLLVLLITGLSAGLLALWVHRKLLRPMLSIASTVDQVTQQQDYSIRSDLAGDDEIGRLALEINLMLTQIERRDLELRESRALAEDHAVSSQKLARQHQEINQLLTKQIEARAAVERELRQAKKMEAIGQLTGGIAHDFNNLLATILGHNQLAQDEARKILAPRVMDCLEEIQTAGTRARDLVAQMLTYSRAGAGSPTALFVSDTAEEATRLLIPTLPDNVTLVRDFDSSVSPVLIDPVQLNQIIMNLCVNARDAIEGDGQIRLRIDSIDLSTAVCSSCRQPFMGQHVRLSVCDNGIGIDASDLGKIFDPFFTTKEVGKGTGMGLSTTHGLVHEHQGHILVDSNAKNGSCFHVLLPPSTETPAAKNAPAVTQSSMPTEPLTGHILIVDDEPALGRFLIRLFEGKGLTAEAETDPREGLKKIQDNPGRFDLLITDMTMPHMSGLELSQSIHEIAPALPIILCTGYSKDDIDYKQAHINTIIPKPIDSNDLFTEIQRLLTVRQNKNAAAS